MIGKTFSGTYTHSSTVVRFIKMMCKILLVMSVLLLIIGIITGDKSNIATVSSVVAILCCLLTLFITTKIIKFSPIECNITIESLNKGIVTAKITGKSLEEITVQSTYGEWNRDINQMTIICADDSVLTFDADKNDYKLLKQESINIKVLAND